MSPFYPTEETDVSRRLYQGLRNTFSETGGCTLIGGWAVDELTTQNYQEQSRDVDVVFSTKAAFNRFRHEVMPAWNMEWAGTARRPTNACRFKRGHGPAGIAVDVFFLEGSDACQQDFHTMGGPLYKDLDCSVWLPRVADLLTDKVATMPKRGNQDAGAKRFKDAIDTWALVFHNVEGLVPRDLRTAVPEHLVQDAAKQMPALHDFSHHHGDVYASAVVELQAWLAG